MTNTDKVEPCAEVRCDDGGQLTAHFYVRDMPLFTKLYPASALAALRQESQRINKALFEVEAKVMVGRKVNTNLEKQLAEAQDALKMAQSEAAAWRLTVKADQEELETVWRMNADVKKERDAAQADAARYRWLRDSGWNGEQYHEVWRQVTNSYGELDAAVDAALKGDV